MNPYFFCARPHFFLSSETLTEISTARLRGRLLLKPPVFESSSMPASHHSFAVLCQLCASMNYEIYPQSDASSLFIACSTLVMINLPRGACSRTAPYRHWINIPILDGYGQPYVLGSTA